jgi:hypothetical protein
MDLTLIFIELSIIVVYLFRYRLFGKKIQILFDRIKFTIEPWWKTIFLPIIIVFLLWIAWAIYIIYIEHSFPTNPFDWGYLLQGVILAGISESILQALLLSFMFLIIAKRFTDPWITSPLYFLSIIGISFTISFLHYIPTPMSFLIRFVNFNIYGLFYYYSKENMVPMISGHMMWNALLIV